ncbi:hypothetical protein NLG97_g6361 [Lecanicillium saksenae]|uniref:Uncharacterized protein n=1 Tax=Lecanicillium saksenae TaxID=468837 RepID=A0ACC1QPU9_9HYPO|nr:hypothetical protein NLG97_g6361 [Lecanicillium saksenae]
MSNSMPRGYASSQFEQKIDTIADHVDSVASLLSGLVPQIRPSNDSHPAQGLSTDTSNPGTLDTVVTCVGVDAYENRGLVAQATFSLRFIRQILQRRHTHSPGGSIAVTLSNIEQLIEVRASRSTGRENTSDGQALGPNLAVSSTKILFTNLPLPPKVATLQTLTSILDSPSPTLFNMVCSLAGVKNVAALCSSLYSQPATVSKFTFITIHVLLYFVFTEAHSESCKCGEGGEDYVPLIDTCEVNIETGIASLPFFVPAKAENVQALLLGASLPALYGITASKPQLAQYLATRAAQICHPWGCRPTSGATPEQTSSLHQVLYWGIYTVEKCLCLKLGPASGMHEYNITLEPQFDFDGFGSLAPTELSTSWIYLALLEGRIYTNMFVASFFQIRGRH